MAKFVVVYQILAQILSSVRAGTGSSCCSSSSSSGSCCRGCGGGWLAVLEVGRLAVARGADPAAAHPHPWIL